ncbi:oxidoreductase [Paenibacillus sp. PK3_47]|uniref:Gfo/Idh/MocA family protein n=1 Tax=Paenibacillus sp. PK3_47 TaxID=2072642 RepID=UPI00201DC9E7|nr:Gfo/Idh/MocA family oxidoreductase [Paenibacillus sp. PK3_47]UQZ33845.1 oxidoreductase [Paenibacillus sp. PK3_47]
MNVVVIGLGSMGKRRIRLIKKYNNQYQIFGIDSSEERRRASEKEYGIMTFANVDELLLNNSLDCAFICTSPLSHSEIISRCLEIGLHVFTELNLVTDGYDENTMLAKENNRILFLSSTFLYRQEVKRIKQLVQESECLLNYTYHIGQYLPDWHPWENYKDYFVGAKRSNGCREIFAIELPWLTDVFGTISKVHVMKNKISSLDIDYNDNYMVMIEHIDGHKGMLAVDVVSRKAVRNFELFGEELFLLWDGSAEGIKVYDFDRKEEKKIQLYETVDQLEQYSKFVVENAYFDEIASFFAVIEKGEEPLYSFSKDKAILNLIDEIEA